MQVPTAVFDALPGVWEHLKTIQTGLDHFVRHVSNARAPFARRVLLLFLVCAQGASTHWLRALLHKDK